MGELKFKPDEAAFLDIETTGLSMKDEITTVALLYNSKLLFFIKNINLDDLFPFLDKIKNVVTFNGSRFDLPLLQLKYNRSLNFKHIDLLPICRKNYLIGGLKQIGINLGIKRFERCHSGSDAVLFWNNYVLKRNVKSLKDLLVYNGNDALSLCQISNFLSGKNYMRSINCGEQVDAFFRDNFGKYYG